MNIAGSPEPNPWWQGRSHLLLAGHLLLLHALAFGGWQLPAVRILWFVALGLFLIWQPFVAHVEAVGGMPVVFDGGCNISIRNGCTRIHDESSTEEGDSHHDGREESPALESDFATFALLSETRDLLC